MSLLRRPSPALRLPPLPAAQQLKIQRLSPLDSKRMHRERWAAEEKTQHGR